MKKGVLKLGVLLAFIVAGISSCQDEFGDTFKVEDQGLSANLLTEAMYPDLVASTPVSAGGIIPYIIPGANQGGNRTCDEVADAFDFTFENSIEKEDQFLEGGTAGPITWWTEDGIYISWESSVPVKAAFIVKGSNDANVYFYGPEDCYSGDSGLASPEAGKSGEAAGLSNITICWTLCLPPPPPCEWIGETAWGEGDRYISRGNWATYTTYEANETFILYAGQTMEAGTIYFSEIDLDGNVTITIKLNEGWRLEEFEGMPVDEAVKIQGYDDNGPLSENPAPGLFTTYKGTDLENIKVEAYKYYGIHLNVEWEYCPEE